MVRLGYVLYHGRQQEPVDVIVYHGKGLQDAWFLIVPPDSESCLPTEEVVRWYAERMQTEHCFRDWRSHLGLRGLHLEVERTQRRTPRHGTRRVLSVLSIAVYMLADVRWQERALRRFLQILRRLTCGRGVALPPVLPP